MGKFFMLRRESNTKNGQMRNQNGNTLKCQNIFLGINKMLIGGRLTYKI